MSHTALGCFWQVIAVPTSRILPDMDTFSQRIHRTLPHAMYFFQIISWDVPELYPLEVALAILCFLKNDEQELRWREEIIERRFLPRFVHHCTEDHHREGHTFLYRAVRLYSDCLGNDGCLLELIRTCQPAFQAKHSSQQQLIDILCR